MLLSFIFFNDLYMIIYSTIRSSIRKIRKTFNLALMLWRQCRRLLFSTTAPAPAPPESHTQPIQRRDEQPQGHFTPDPTEHAKGDRVGERHQNCREKGREGRPPLRPVDVGQVLHQDAPDEDERGARGVRGNGGEDGVEDDAQEEATRTRHGRQPRSGTDLDRDGALFEESKVKVR